MTNRKLSLQFTEWNSLQFAERLKGLVDSYESISALARNVGVVEGTIRKWANGLSRPKIDEAVKLAQTLDVHLLWLATGEGPQLKNEEGEKDQQASKKDSAPVLDMKRLRLAIETVEEAFNDKGVTMDPDRKAELVAAIYDLYADNDSLDKTPVLRLIKTMT